MDPQAALDQSETVAVIGCSANRYRASHHAAVSLAARSFLVIPVNPKYQSVNGVTCYADFDDVPDDVLIDIVNIFRNPAETLRAVESVVRRVRRTGRKPIVWTQPGVSTIQARQMAEDEGLPYVRDRCIMVELARRD